ncbi:Uncharacterised protein [Mycobacteroides abscessus subsp. abscessus]|nr:Uncharacterised protein [Mycobacteroides abscessus subsp. abscessus]
MAPATIRTSPTVSKMGTARTYPRTASRTPRMIMMLRSLFRTRQRPPWLAPR